MSTVDQIITKAYRESNLISINAAPTDLQRSEALDLLNEIIPSVLSFEGAGPLQPFPIGMNNRDVPSYFPWGGSQVPTGEWWAPLQAQLVVNLTAAQEVDLHPQPTDGSRLGVIDTSQNLATYNLTLKGNGYRIENATELVLTTDGLAREWFFRADLGNWVRATTLTYTDSFPFPIEFEQMFYSMLAMRLNPRYGRELSPESQAALIRAKRFFQARYQPNIEYPSEMALRRLWIDKYYGTWWSTRDANSRFSSGYPY